jgi:hypothetical protein
MFIPFTADEILLMDKDQLQTFRGGIFTHYDSEDLLKFGDTFLEFCMMLTMVQDMCAWRKLAEPGMAAWMIDDGDLEEEIEQAREMDRHSIAFHSEVSSEFEEAGGKEGFQNVINRLNAYPDPPMRLRDGEDLL